MDYVGIFLFAIVNMKLNALIYYLTPSRLFADEKYYLNIYLS